MAEDHVVAIADGAFPQRMDIGRADGDGKGFDNGIERTAFRRILLDPAGFADPEHRVTFHGTPSFS